MLQQWRKSTFIKTFLSTILAVTSFLCLPGAVHAATLSLAPAASSVTVGNIVSMKVLVGTGGQAVNSSDGTVTFPTDLLQVISINKDSSVFPLWVEDPAFSNTAGTVTFDGGIPTPGFTGENGEIFSIVFQAKQAGVATVLFSDGSVHANDGLGTDILSGKSSAQVTISTPVLVVPVTSEQPVVVAGAPKAPVITSDTHPDQNRWYSNSSPSFSWTVPAGVTSVRLQYDRNPVAVPGVTYASAINKKKLTNIPDGVYYFHVQLKNASGWGAIANFRFQIDTQSPSPFKIKFIGPLKTQNTTPTVTFDTTDALSGIDYYKIKIGDADSFEVSSDTVKSNPYTLPSQDIGTHTILVQAFDKAGNYATDSADFTISALLPPTFIDYSDELQSGDPLIVHGSTYPNSKVTVSLQGETGDPIVTTVDSDSNGKFTYLADQRLGEGIYKLWATVEDSHGSKSGPTDTIAINVEKSAIVRAGTLAISILAVVVPVVALIVILLICLWYGWHKFSKMRKNLRKEVHEAESALHKAFDLMKESIHEQVKMLEKTGTERQLTDEEEKVIKQLKRDLTDAEKYIKKEIEDIEHEIG